MRRVIVLASGPSVKEQGVNLTKLREKGFVIGVNDAAIRADVDCAVSMDRLWMEYRAKQLAEKNFPTYFRDSAWEKRDQRKGPIPAWENLFLFRNMHQTNQMTDDKNSLNGTSSGVCGINLAMHMKPYSVFLFGFDMKRSVMREPYWHEPYPWNPAGGTSDGKYEEWSKLFAPIDTYAKHKGIQVFNVSPDSAIPNFPKITYKEFLEM